MYKYVYNHFTDYWSGSWSAGMAGDKNTSQVNDLMAKDYRWIGFRVERSTNHEVINGELCLDWLEDKTE